MAEGKFKSDICINRCYHDDHMIMCTEVVTNVEPNGSRHIFIIKGSDSEAEAEEIVESVNAMRAIPSPGEFVDAALAAVEAWDLSEWVNGRLEPRSADDIEKAMTRLRAAAPNRKETS